MAAGKGTFGGLIHVHNKTRPVSLRPLEWRILYVLYARCNYTYLEHVHPDIDRVVPYMVLFPFGVGAVLWTVEACWPLCFGKSMVTFPAVQPLPGHNKQKLCVTSGISSMFVVITGSKGKG
jgi:hypothetical protein